MQEYSHCSNPEVLYGAIASRTERIRLGYGVRLMPKPYNHPVRTAESVAVLDLHLERAGRPGTGRSATRAELEGFGIDPAESRRMWQEAIGHVVGCWTNEEYEFSGEHWQMPKRRVQPKPWQKPHPPLWGATTSDEGHAQVGDLGLGLCSFAVGLPPAEVKRKIDIYRAAVAQCTEPIGVVRAQPGGHLHHGHLRTRPRRGHRRGPRVLRVVPQDGRPPDRHAHRLDGRAQRVARLLLLRGRHEEDATTRACSTCSASSTSWTRTPASSAPPTSASRRAAYEAAGVDLLLCLVNPYKISHESVMQTIELMGTEVIPPFAD